MESQFSLHPGKAGSCCGVLWCALLCCFVSCPASFCVLCCFCLEHSTYVYMPLCVYGCCIDLPCAC
jgi:hypothetical protein